MAAEFEVFGPYPIDREGVHEKKWQKEAWESVNQEVGADLAGARGVYVFSIRHGKKRTPLYVGMTTKAFRSEVFALHNTNKFATKWRTHRGKIEVHLLAKRKGVHNGFSKNVSKYLLETLEVLLIFMCRRSNNRLINKKNIKWLDEAGIKGITGVQKQLGQPKLAVQSFKHVINW